MLLPLQLNNLLEGDIAPIFSGAIPDIFQRKDTGTFTYDLSVYFSGADTYAIDPAVETGWSFDTNTGVLVIDTDAIGVFGPFTVTASNANGDTDSNAFRVEVAAANSGAGRKRRKERYYVEIDGQEFEVSSPSEALSLLARARDVAEAQIEKARASPVRVARGIRRPRITTDSPELRAVVRQAREEITSLYDAAIRDLEIAALMKAADEEDEALIRLLM
jgi:hypothetical protein